MKLLNLLTISFLLALSVRGTSYAQGPCKEIKATTEIKNSTGQNDGSITITIEGNSANFRVYLIAPRKEDNRLDVPVEEIKDLSPGNYDLVITEAKAGEYCPKRIKVAIK